MVEKVDNALKSSLEIDVFYTSALQEKSAGLVDAKNDYQES